MLDQLFADEQNKKHTTSTCGPTTTTGETITQGTTKPTKDTTRSTLGGRVSITFDVGPGWKGTMSRDFPGRAYSSSEKKILQSWSKEFRQVIFDVL